MSYKKGLHVVFKAFGVEIRPAHHIKLYHLFSIILFFLLVKMMCRPGPIGLKAATPLKARLALRILKLRLIRRKCGIMIGTLQLTYFKYDNKETGRHLENTHGHYFSL